MARRTDFCTCKTCQNANAVSVCRSTTCDHLRPRKGPCSNKACSFVPEPKDQQRTSSKFNARVGAKKRKVQEEQAAEAASAAQAKSAAAPVAPFLSKSALARGAVGQLQQPQV